MSSVETPAGSKALAEGLPCPGCGALQVHPPFLLQGRDRMTGAAGEFCVVACEGCGLAYTLPRLGEEDFATYYPDDYSAYREPSRLRGRRSPGQLVETFRLQALARFGPYRRIWRRPPGRLLDVGCGTGDLASVFGAGGWRVAGVEPSPDAAQRARDSGIEAITGTLEDSPWQEASFDAVIFSHSLEHIDDPAAAVRRAARLLRPGGLLAIAVPNFGSWHRRAFGSAWFQLDLPRHLQHFDRHSLASLVRRAGLRPVAVNAASMRPSPIASVQYLIFGGMRYQGRGFRILSWLLAPFLVLSDRIGEGDCLHLIAERSAGE